MKKISKISATVLILMIGVSVVHATKFVVQNAKAGRPLSTTARTRGNENAPIKIVEFIDFQCPACAHGSAYLKEMIEKHPQAIRLDLRYYPLQMHRHGYSSARYAECAARQGKFWGFLDPLLARQSIWQRLVDAKPAFDKIARDIHLDMEDFETCLKDESVDEIINKDRAEGEDLKIRSTPTYFINGKMVVGSNNLKEEIAELLKKNGY